MKKITMSAVALTAIMGSFSSVSAADGVNILNDLKVQGEIRPRYEFVNDNISTHTNANAITARTKLKVTGKLLDIDGLTASVGIISVNNFGSHQYNWNGTDYTDGTNKYATVMDPQTAMMSNAEINYKTGKTLLHAGRSPINLDNQRFIGTVGWRQLERSYDAVYAANSSVKNLSLLAAWVYGYQGVVEGNTVDTNTVLLHAAYKVMPALKVTAYDYMIANTHDTYGLALTGKIKLDMAKINYRAEYAMQKDATMEIHTQTPTTGNADADYYNLDLGANISGILVGVNYEFLSGSNGTDGKTNFQPTLGTNHKFNGWADKFFVGNTGPQGGLIDANVRLGYKAKGLGKLLAVYHNFTADKTMATTTGTSDDLGSEFDVVYVNKVPGVNGLTGMLKYADYSKGAEITDFTNVQTDTQKFWAMLDYKFSTK
jgi:hypothetical protein